MSEEQKQALGEALSKWFGDIDFEEDENEEGQRMNRTRGLLSIFDYCDSRNIDDLIERAILPHVCAPADAKPVLRITKNGPYIETQPTEEAFELASGEYELFTRPAVELSDKPYQAAISCPHTIDNDRVVLEFDPKQPGHNALAQLALRLSAHAPTAVEYEIRGERAAQDAQWGGAAHDDAHDSGDFLEFIGNQAGKAIADYDKAADTPEAEAAAFRARFVKIAALANAAIESIDRKAKA